MTEAVSQTGARSTRPQTPIPNRSVGDLVAGFSVALVLIPQCLAYARLAGLPAHYGLYAAALPPMLAAAFVSSPYLQTGPTALTSLLTLGAISAVVTPGSETYIGYAMLLAVVVGVVRVGLGLARLGPLAHLMSVPVLRGFTAAAGILIAASQLPTALGVDPPVTGVLYRAGWALVHPGQWLVGALIASALTIGFIFGGRRLHSLFPGVLVAVLVTIGLSVYGFDLGPVLGHIPTGFPSLHLDLPWSSIGSLLVPGAVIALVGFAEPASIARTFAARDRLSWNADRELISQGVANIVSGFSGGFPVGGSFSRSALNRAAGARTRLSGFVTGLVGLMFLPFADVLVALPKPVLGATVLTAVVSLLEPRPILELWKLSRPQATVAWVTFGSTLALAPHVEYGVIFGVALAAGVHLWRELRVEVFVEADDEARTLVLYPRGVVWYGSASTVQTVMLDALAAHPDTERLLIDLSGSGRVDLTGANALEAIATEAIDAGLEVTISGAPPQSVGVVHRVCGELEADVEATASTDGGRDNQRHTS